MGNRELYVHLFCTRNKDNEKQRNDKNWKQHSKSFISMKSDEELRQDFLYFCSKHKTDTCRWYKTVNARDSDKVVLDLQHYLLDNPTLPLDKLSAKLASLAEQTKNAVTKKWLFDYDGPLEDIHEFIEDVIIYGNFDDEEVKPLATLSNSAVIVPHGFDVRELLEKPKWHDCVTLLRDGMLLVDWSTPSVVINNDKHK